MMDVPLLLSHQLHTGVSLLFEPQLWSVLERSWCEILQLIG